RGIVTLLKKEHKNFYASNIFYRTATAFRQHIFDVAKAQGEPQIEPDRLLDDFGGKPVPFVADFLHPLGYRTASEAASKICRDKAIWDIGVDVARRSLVNLSTPAKVQEF